MRLRSGSRLIQTTHVSAQPRLMVVLTGISDGFDVVAECTGVESIVNNAINYVSRGGTLLVYGVYADNARVSWSPTKIFIDEIRQVKVS